MAESLLCFPCCIGGQPQPKRRTRPRIDPSMIGLPTDFRHTAHVGSGDVSAGPDLHSVQGQMSSKGDYSHQIAPGHLQLSVVDLPSRRAPS
ncbi:Cdc42 small effector protein 2-like [Plakobranchus ocellatus]|uniref:Cdc42 small effector protein 2-like n=1 Tax=Plakobranchus ocellatus TaxID=259542 RepID=A0AAV4AL84_9GAST|nr:Cdc42 small effector protein 2-like [Plakobranchus ocellatus]